MESEPQAPTLRARLTLVTTGLALLALLLTTALVLLTTALHRNTAVLGAAVEGVRLAEEAQVTLLLHVRAVDPLVKRNLERDAQRRLAAVRTYVSSDAEERAIDVAEARVRDYLAIADDPGRPRAEVAAAVEAAYAALEELVEFEVAEARAARARADGWDGLANVVGALAIALLIAVLGGTLYWLWARAFQPLFALASTMERYARGDRDARMAASGSQELRSMVQRWNEVTDALAAQRQAQSAFLGGVAHDLRNPLSALKLSLAAIPPDGPLPPEPHIRRTLATLDRQLSRIERMLEDFLDMAKIEAGELELRCEQHDARSLIQHVADLFDASPSRQRLQVRLPGEPVWVLCDALRIEQVVGNLVSNAFKHGSDQSPVVLTLRAERDQAVIEVVDRGPGISPQEQAELFKPFRRGLGAEKRTPGLGLGLFMVRRIVDAHRGQIEVDSSPGEGSTFRIRLARIAGPHRALPRGSDLLS